MNIMNWKMKLKCIVLLATICKCSTSSIDIQRTENIALHKPTVQDGVLHYPANNPGALWTSNNAVDGKKDCPQEANYSTYSGTAEKDTPWWQVDLGDVYTVTNITVYGRPTKLPAHLIGFKVYVSLKNETKGESDVYNNTKYDTNGVFTNVIRNGTYLARYVTLVLPKSADRQQNGPLVLCEVEVYGVLSSKVFNIGPAATISSSSVLSYGNYNYNEGNVIDQNPRSDPDGCNCCWSSADEQNPWLKAILPIPIPLITINIIGRTDLQTPDTDKRNLVGLKVSIDDVTVPNSRILYNTTTNSILIDARSKNVKNITFTRPGIKSEWFIIICEIILNRHVCRAGRYGYICNNTCGNCAGSGCSSVSGTCDAGCREGFAPPLCKDECPDLKYGFNCSMSCGHCLRQEPCNKTTGVCSNGCNAGYKGPNCNQICEGGKYGLNCSKTCGNCAQHSSCNNVNGTCPNGCLDGFLYNDTFCKTACPSGKYGNKCVSDCGNCAGELSCNTSTGYCKNGCSNGYHLPKCDKQCTNNTFGPNCVHECHCSRDASSVCDIFNGNCSNGCDIGWEGKNCSIDLDILQNQTTNATATQSGQYGQCKASRAIDGNDKPDDPANDTSLCTACSVANNSVSPKAWWQLDLGWLFLVQYFRIIGRSNMQLQSRNIDAYIGNMSMSGGISDEIFNINTSTGYEFLINLSTPRMFQFLKIMKNTVGVLTLCEVKIYEAVCPKGNFGDRCSNECHCSDNLQCHSITGNCVHEGCSPGWKGRSCNASCNDQHFGHDCIYQCHCFNNTSCLKDNGICSNQRCDPGWQLQNCSQACDFPQFGDACNSTCHCLNGTSCDHVFGECELHLCEPGWKDDSCDRACDYRSFGFNCSLKCHCRDNTTCDAASGMCPMDLCDPGWQRPSCDIACDYRSFGGDCSTVCNCRDNTSCDAISGECLTGLCDPGWQGSSCDEACNVRSFGYNCSSICHCVDNTTCDVISGVCDTGLCDPGWQGPSCDKACDYRSFGVNCSSICNCRDNTSCDVISGKCLMGLCDPGWQGSSCDKACNCPSFGYNCSSVCHCLDNATCDATYGVCDTGLCDPGWQGSSCDEVCDYRSFGYNCSTKCHCRDNTTCDAASGMCTIGLCDPGWRRPSCDKACDYRSFGGNCSTICNCRDNTSCDAISGKCLTGLCDPGWQGSSCDKVCDNNTFGLNCSRTCHCQGNTGCDHISGQCKVGLCDPGWRNDSCDKECDNNTFGVNCSSQCHCLGKRKCDHISGYCEVGLCDPGWKNSSCDQDCGSGTFGMNCSHECHCKSNTYCSPITGICEISGCEGSWTGGNCSIAVEQTSDEPASVTGIAAGTTAAVVGVALGVIIAFVIYKRKQSDKGTSGEQKQFSHLDSALERRKTRSDAPSTSKTYARDNESFEAEEETNMSTTGGDYYSFGEKYMRIRIHELWDYIYEKKKNACILFYTEFKTLPSGLVHPCTAADKLTNKGKNRYREMYAYDHSRVVLEGVEEGKNTDYINACYINGYDKTKKFVASQGPTKQMINDFWRMVWQLKSDKIVMLTNLIEMGTKKCLQYWPIEDEQEECCLGNLIIKVLKTETYLDYNIRHFQVRKDGEPVRIIHQFHFKSWPDKDVPDSTWCLVNFWRAVNTNAPSKAGPIVVHCSAGVGRTGTFIALDNLVTQATTEGCVRPLQIVEALRMQRVNMVQTREQYVYLHEAVADALLCGTYIIWAKQFGEMLTFMLHKGKGETKTKLEAQFELIGKSIKDDTSEDDTAEYSNVETLHAESAAYRPKLKNRGSKFVQQLAAIYIPNYKGKNTFLVSMSPDRTTMEEFWFLVDDSNIKTVIMLTETSAPSYQASCQLGASANNGNRFSVNKIEEKIRKGYTERTFTFKESDREDEEYLTTVKQFEYTAWKDGYAAPGDTRSLLDMIDSVQKWQPHLSESQPILIHCSDGCSRSGVACMFLNELQRMKYEGGHINILESVKMMKKRQRHLIGTYEQYRFCFDLILAHIKSTEVYENL